MEGKMAQSSSQAAKTFNKFGSVRYYIATLRKAAVQMPYKNFITLTKEIDFVSYKKQIPYLRGTLKIASYIFLVSKTIFYYVAHILFKD